MPELHSFIVLMCTELVYGHDNCEYKSDCLPCMATLATCQRAGDVCRDTKQPLDPQQVVAQGLVFIIAGYETISTTLSFTVALLSQNPAAEARLLKEIDAHADQLPTLETMAQWPYAMVRPDNAQLCDADQPAAACLSATEACTAWYATHS
jgi:Cytochrome P450